MAVQLTSASRSSAAPVVPSSRLYRLVDQQGAPHPILDDLDDSLEAAWADAQKWWRQHSG
ncbi:MAG: hypothetical protein VKI83_10375 [Synechococcaceae cyanobacterium]|nr:hypothetical protein [Synechococcaceae cyanobacterium]